MVSALFSQFWKWNLLLDAWGDGALSLWLKRRVTDFVVCFVSSGFDLPGPSAHPVNRQYFETTWATAWTIIDLPLSWNLVTVHSIHVVFLSNYWPGWYLVTVHSHPKLRPQRKMMIEAFLKVVHNASNKRSRKSCWSFWASVGLVTSIKFRSVTSALSSAETSVETNVLFSLVTIALFIFLRTTQCRNWYFRLHWVKRSAGRVMFLRSKSAPTISWWPLHSSVFKYTFITLQSIMTIHLMHPCSLPVEMFHRSSVFYKEPLLC